MPRKNCQANLRTKCLYFVAGMLALTSSPLLFSVLFRQTNNSPAPLVPAPICNTQFRNITYTNNNNSNQVETILMGEAHQSNEEIVAECLDSLASPGDHLLLELPNAGKEIPCDEFSPAYSR